MERRSFGRLGQVSALSLGGGGIGNVWGAVERDEAIATVRAAVDAGITLLDLAPVYGPGERSPEAELVVGDAFSGGLPAGVMVTSKVIVSDASPRASIPSLVRDSRRASAARLGGDRIDLFFLHSFVRPTDMPATHPEVVEIDTVREVVLPEFEQLAADGRIGHWGLTGAGHPDAICELLEGEPKPAAVQCVTNALDSAPDMWPFDASDSPDNLRIRTVAVEQGVAVMGIRAAAAGALTDGFDRAVSPDDPMAAVYRRARRFVLWPTRAASRPPTWRIDMPSRCPAWRRSCSAPRTGRSWRTASPRRPPGR